MIRAVIVALFATPSPTSWVPGLGMIALPGALTREGRAYARCERRCAVGRPLDRRSVEHDALGNVSAPVRSNGNIGHLSGEGGL